MSLIFKIALKSMSTSIHHKVAVEALGYIDEEWRKLFLKNIHAYLKGSKAPDKEFKDFKNHVYHVHQKWGGAPSSVDLWFGKLKESIQKEDWKEAAYNAGVMSHYFVDVHHPFHTAQCEEEKRIHAYTEFGGAEIYQKKIKPLINVQNHIDITNIVKFVENSAKPSFEYYSDFFSEFKIENVKKNKWGMAYTDRLIDITAELLSKAIAGNAALLNKAITEQKVEPKKYNLGLKSFVEGLAIPVYWIMKKLDKKEKDEITEEMEEEFNANGEVYETLISGNKELVDTYREDKKKNSSWVDYPKKIDFGNTQKSLDENIAKEKVSKSKSKSSATTPTSKSNTVTNSKGKDSQYYLHETDPIEDAAEIGGKTAQRLQKVGIKTIKDLIEADSKSLSKKIGVNYITSTVISRWQTEAILNCTVPKTRSTDARIMYQMGIRKREDMKKYSHKELLKIAIDAAEKLGERVVSAKSKPTLEEVTRWRDA